MITASETPQVRCDVCHVDLGRGGFMFIAGADQAFRCRRHALAQRRTLVQALRVALVVGTVLTAINELDLMVGTGLTPLVLAKVLLNYCVPFMVSLYSGLAASRR